MSDAQPTGRDPGGPPLHEALAAALRRDHGPVELRETHASWVLLAGDRAYKLKKPVRFAFLDYSTPALRRAACDEELRVNLALAAAVMLGVRGLRRVGDAVELCPADAAGALDWVVVMRRYDEGRTMAALLARGELSEGHVRAAAARVAAFHRAADVVRDPDPAARACAAVARNRDELAAAAPEGPCAARAEALGSFVLTGLEARGADLEARARAGLVRDGHGDLRAEHVVLGEGEVLVVDRIEFDPGLRRIDVADDVGFLAMDLESLDGAAGPGLGGAEAARLLLAGYRAAGGAPGDPALVALFGAHRALVRAKVELLRAGQPGERESSPGQPGARESSAGQPGAGERIPERARRLLDLAARLGWRGRGPLALVVCGPPASGKSTLAAALATRSGLPVLSSDLVRREVIGAGSGEANPTYTPAARAAVYAELGRRACARLREGGGLVVDATFGDEGLRAAFLEELPDGWRDSVRAVICRAPLDVLLARASEPRTGGSDAGPEVAERLAAAFGPPVEVGADRLAEVDGTAPVDVTIAAIEAWLPAGSAGGRAERPAG